MLYNTTKPLDVHIQLQREIRVGMDGLSRDMGLFELKWERKGLREAKSDKDWVVWKEVEAMTRYFPEPIGCFRKDCKHYNEVSWSKDLSLESDSYICISKDLSYHIPY